MRIAAASLSQIIDHIPDFFLITQINKLTHSNNRILVYVYQGSHSPEKVREICVRKSQGIAFVREFYIQ